MSTLIAESDYLVFPENEGTNYFPSFSSTTLNEMKAAIQKGMNLVVFASKGGAFSLLETMADLSPGSLGAVGSNCTGISIPNSQLDLPYYFLLPWNPPWRCIVFLESTFPLALSSYILRCPLLILLPL